MDLFGQKPAKAVVVVNSEIIEKLELVTDKCRFRMETCNHESCFIVAHDGSSPGQGGTVRYQSWCVDLGDPYSGSFATDGATGRHRMPETSATHVSRVPSPRFAVHPPWRCVGAVFD